jgi:hypothetical protein
MEIAVSPKMRAIPIMVLAALVLPLTMVGAGAQNRPDSLKMSCETARRLVSERGAVVLGTGPDIYDRYVATQSFCQRDEQTDPVWLRTADSRQCFIGYRCKRVSEEFER